MSKSITDIFDISSEDTSQVGPLLSVAGLRTRSPLYAAETRNLERRRAYAARRGESTVSITNRMARVGAQGSTIEGEVTKLRYVTERTDGKAAIYGLVTVRGIAAEGLVVAAYDLDGGALEPAVRTDASGTFALVVEPAQPVRVVVSTEDLKVLRCLDTVFDLTRRPRFDVTIALESTEPVPVAPEYPCDLPPDHDDDPRPELVEVPDLAGLTLEDASDRLVAVGLSGDFSVQDDADRDGVVLDQGVPAGRKVPLGTVIEVTMAELRLPTVPDVRGRASRTATAVVKRAGFEPVTVDVDAEGEPGTVVDQFPEADTPAVAGSRVGLLVVREQTRELVEVPPVIGMKLEEASATLRDAGLQVGALAEVPAGERDAGVVTQQKPAEGAKVPGGSPVDLVLTRAGGPRMTMPKVTGTVGQAARGLSAGDWAGVRVRFAPDPLARMQVVEQHPAEGEDVSGTEAVDLLVRPQTSWKDQPQQGASQLFVLSPDWLRAGASAARSRVVAQAIAAASMDDLRELATAAPEVVAERLGLDDPVLAEPLRDAVAFAARTMAELT